MSVNSSVRLSKPPAYRWWILVMNVLVNLQFFMTVQAVNAFGGTVQSSLSLSATELALLTTATMITLAFLPSVGARIQGGLGVRKTVCIALIINIVATFVLPFVQQNYAALILVRLVQGCCGGLSVTSVVSSMAMWFPVKQRGLASGILLGILGVGFSVSTFVAPRLLELGFDWGTSLCIMLNVPAIIILVLYWFTVRDISSVYPNASTIQELLPKEAQSADSVVADVDSLPKTMAAAKKSKAFWAACFFGFASAWLTYSFSAFLPVLLSVDMGVDAGTVTSIMSITFFVTFVASPLGGIVSDKVFKGSRWQVLLIGNVVTIITLVITPVTPVSLLALVLVLAYGSVSLCTGPFWMVPNEIVHPSVAPQAVGFMQTISNLGGVLTGFILSIFIDASGGGMLPLIICVAFAALSAVSTLMLRSRK